MDLLNALKEKLGLGGKPDRGPSVYGLRDEYQRYALDAQMNGEQPIPFGEYVRQKQMNNQPVAPVQAPAGGIPKAAPGYDTFFKR